MNERQPITQLLAAMRDGDHAARDKLWSLVYDTLHSEAQRQMADEAAGRTLQPTELLNEVYIRLMGGAQPQWANRKMFFTFMGNVMRHYRVDDARRRNSLKRGGGDKPVPLGSEPEMFDQDPAEVLAVHEALQQLSAIDPRKADVVHMRYFLGLTGDETADAL